MLFTPPKYTGPPLPDELFIKDGIRIVSEAEKQGIVLRVLGALAIRIHSMDYTDLHKKLGRLGRGKQTFSDIDFMAYGEQRERVRDFFEKDLSYIADKYRMLLFGSWKRHIYHHPKGYYHTDVFFDKLEFSHDISFGERPGEGRLELDKPTITLSDLVLEKVQIHRIDEKDIKDLIVLLRAHEFGEADEEEIINSKRIAMVLADDWGFWYDATQNLEKVKVFANKYHGEGLLGEETLSNVLVKVDELLESIEREPKTKKWEKRAKKGTSKKWYRDVEEIMR